MSSSAGYQNITQLEGLCQKLDTAEKKIIEYAQLIASLSADLKRCQDIMCHPCKEKLFRASVATTPPPAPSGSASAVLSQPTGSSTIVAPGYPGNIGATLSVQAAPPFPLLVHDQSSGVIQPTVPFPPTTITNSEPQQLVVQSISESETIAGPDWSVEYNSEITQVLSLRVDKTFEFTATVYCAKFSHDGKSVAVGLRNGETHIHNMVTGSKSILVARPATVFYTEVVKALHQVWALQFSPDDKFIAIGDHHGQINMWEIARGRLRARFKHTALVRDLDFSPDGRFIASASYDSTACIWHIRDGSRRTLWQGNSYFVSVAFSPDGRSVATANSNGLLRVWDARTGQLVSKCMNQGRSRLKMRSTVFTPDGKGIAGGINTLRRWDMSWLTGNRHSGPQGGTTGEMNQIFESYGHERPITAVSFSADNLWVLSGSLDCSVRILDAQTGSWVCTLRGHTINIWGADFSPAGYYLVSGGGDRLVRLWRYDEVEQVENIVH